MSILFSTISVVGSDLASMTTDVRSSVRTVFGVENVRGPAEGATMGAGGPSEWASEWRNH